jgi:quinohemoprotein ethanol dehydrogenase
MTYEVNGEQYVAALSGYGGAFFLYIGAVLPPAGEIPNGRVLVYKLGGKEKAPPIDLKPIPIPEPPTLKADAKTVEAGNVQFHGHGCFVCHGFGGVSRSAVPDLRRSPILADKDGWLEVVNGGRLENGMPDFSKAVTAEQAEQMRAYIAARAATGYAEQQAGKPN